MNGRRPERKGWRAHRRAFTSSSRSRAPSRTWRSGLDRSASRSCPGAGAAQACQNLLKGMQSHCELDWAICLGRCCKRLRPHPSKGLGRRSLVEGVSHPSADLTEVQGREQEEERSRVTQRGLSCEDQDVSGLSQLCPWCKSATQPLALREGT